MARLERLPNVAVYRIDEVIAVVEHPGSAPRVMFCSCPIWAEFRRCQHVLLAEADARALNAARQGARGERG